MKLDPKALAISIGLLWGGCVFLVAVCNQFVPAYGGGFLDVVSSIYPGFHPGGLVAAVVGGLYAVVDGAVGGALVAWLYNKANSAPTAS